MQLDSKIGNDEGVSPIVSVILMIVVSVILASIVLGFALGLTDYLREPPQAGITLNQKFHKTGPNSGTYSVTVVVSSLPNADSVSVQGPTTSVQLKKVGAHTTLKGLEKGDLVIITAKKGQQEVVIRKYNVG